jgi:hypothetical protein
MVNINKWTCGEKNTNIFQAKQQSFGDPTKYSERKKYGKTTNYSETTTNVGQHAIKSERKSRKPFVVTHFVSSE